MVGGKLLLHGLSQLCWVRTGETDTGAGASISIPTTANSCLLGGVVAKERGHVDQ